MDRHRLPNLAIPPISAIGRYLRRSLHRVDIIRTRAKKVSSWDAKGPSTHSWCGLALIGRMTRLQAEGQFAGRDQKVLG
jgi:hypothetical protein